MALRASAHNAALPIIRASRIMRPAFIISLAFGVMMIGKVL
jgi:hypothetical protein